MNVLISATDIVLHIEVDLADPEILLFADLGLLKSTNGITSTTLVGSAPGEGYVEGTGTSARFSYIPGFYQHGVTTIIIADCGNHCLRQLNRTNLQTSPFVGQCTNQGYVDGGSGALFTRPHTLIKDPRFASSIIVTDGSAVRIVDLITRETSTLIPQSQGLISPKGIACNLVTNNLFIVDDHSIWKYNLRTQSLKKISGSGTTGNIDGSLSEARFNSLRKVIVLSEDIILVSSRVNQKLRVVNFADNSVSSICTGSAGTANGNTDFCELNVPYGLLLSEGRRLLVGQTGSIRTVPGES